MATLLLGRWILCGVCMCLLLGYAAAFAEETASKPISVNWRTYHEARAEGKNLSRPILLHFSSYIDGRDQDMKRTTYTDRHILNYLDAHFVCAQVNVERLPALARKYKIESNPTIWLLDSAGKPLTHVDGYLGPERLLAILQYVATEAYTTLSYQDWKDGKRP